MEGMRGEQVSAVVAPKRFQTQKRFISAAGVKLLL
jgi:hypothetical protein